MEESTVYIENANAVEADQNPASVNVGDTAALVYKKGAWSKEEDEKLKMAVDEHGLRNWVAIEKYSGLARPAKNCRLRWLNYLRPNLKKYPFTEEEEYKILHLHAKYGNSWSRIAAKLPGRSDNDIKNFWHKRAKKCQKHHLPIYPPSIQDHQQDPTPTDSSDINTTDDVYYPNFDNNPDQTLSPYVLNADSPISTSMYSTQTTPISTPKPQFHSSSCSPLPSPTNFTNKTNVLSSETPTSRPPPQNSLLSPHKISRSTDTTPTQNQDWHERKPPILSSPQGRFNRFTGARTQSVSALLNTDSSMQLKCSLAMESPKSPMNLKLSPGIPAVYSVTASSPATPDSTILNPHKNLNTPGASSSSEFQLKSPSTAPQSPLPVSLPSPRPNPELPPIPPKKVEPDHDSSTNAKTEPPSIQFHSHGVESDSNLEILDELKEAQERVKILKKRLRQQSKVSNKRSLPKESPRSETSDLTVSGYSSQCTGKEQLINISSRERNALKRTVTRKDGDSKTGLFKRVKSESEILYLQESENSETRTLSDDASQIDHPPHGDIMKRGNSMIFQEPMNSLNLSDHNSQNNVNDPNSDSWCSSLESLFCESSSLVHDTFSIEDLFDQKSGTDAFGSLYSQSNTATTLVQSDEGGFYSNSFGQEFSHGSERKFVENALMDQYLTPDVLDSGYLVSEPSPEGEQFTFQTSGEENLVGNTTLQHEVQPYLFPTPSDGFFGGGSSRQTWKQEPTRDQRLTDSLLVENLWPEQQQIVPQEQRLPTNRNDSVVSKTLMTRSMEANNLNGEPSNGHTGLVRKQELGHNYRDTMPDDLSSLLEFFPSSMQTLEWYNNNGNVFPGTEDFDEFDYTSSASMLPITIADYM